MKVKGPIVKLLTTLGSEIYGNYMVKEYKKIKHGSCNGCIWDFPDLVGFLRKILKR